MPHKRAKRSVRLAEAAQKGYNLEPSSSSRGDTPRSAARVLNAFSARAAFKAAGRVSSEDTGEYKNPKKIKKPGAIANVQIKNKSNQNEKNKTIDNQPPTLVADKAKGKERAKRLEVPSILPHETLGEYNRRVESILRPGVSAAIKSAAAASRKGHLNPKLTRDNDKKKGNKGEKDGDDIDQDGGGGGGGFKFEDREIKTFAEAPMRKRVGDVAEAPPSLPRLRQAEGKSPFSERVVAGSVGKGTRKDAYKVTGRTPLSAGQARIMEEERERVVAMYREMKARREAEKAAERESSGKLRKKRQREV